MNLEVHKEFKPSNETEFKIKNSIQSVAGNSSELEKLVTQQ